MIHMILQGKGGVGKSYVASLLSQYMIHKHKRENVTIYDIDHINASLGHITDLKVKVYPVTEDDMLDTRQFDELIEEICGYPTSQNFVIDTGAATFDELSQYMYKHGVYDLLSDLHKVVVHTPIVGGSAFNDTIVSYTRTVVGRTPESVMLVPWLNDFMYGSVEEKIVDRGKGEVFEDTAPYKNNSQRTAGVMRLPVIKDKLVMEDLNKMTSNHYTLDQAISEFNIVAKSRLKKYKAAIYSMLDELEYEPKNDGDE